jgi:hypothetical protein
MRRESIPGLRRCPWRGVTVFCVVADDDSGLGHDDFERAIVRIATAAGSGLYFPRGRQDLHIKS